MPRYGSCYLLLAKYDKQQYTHCCVVQYLMALRQNGRWKGTRLFPLVAENTLDAQPTYCLTPDILGRVFVALGYG